MAAAEEKPKPKVGYRAGGAIVDNKLIAQRVRKRRRKLGLKRALSPASGTSLPLEPRPFLCKFCKNKTRAFITTEELAAHVQSVHPKKAVRTTTKKSPRKKKRVDSSSGNRSRPRDDNLGKNGPSVIVGLPPEEKAPKYKNMCQECESCPPMQGEKTCFSCASK